MLKSIPLSTSRGPAPAGPESKLALVEKLLRSDDLAQCAQHAVEWLAEELGTAQVACMVTLAQSRLTTLAAHGVKEAGIAAFDLDASNRADPLTAVLFRQSPAYFAKGPRQPRTPLTDTAFHAFPLRMGDGEGQASGVLLVSCSGPSFAADHQWLASLLGQRVVQLKPQHTPSESAQAEARERDQLRTIIDHITDPILLTDTEGQLLIANGRAEHLFSAPEEASEGRRRAVTLNNMLFSAALTAALVEHHDSGRQELLLADPLDGSDLLFELLCSSQHKDTREGTFVVSVLRNVTDLGHAKKQIDESLFQLQRAQAEVRAERHRIELIMDSVADPILVTDPEGDIVLMNAPAEKLFTVETEAGEDAQHRVRVNDAHFSSFVSNLLFAGDETTWRGELGLVDPLAGRLVPVEAIAGKVLSEQGELNAVVTILHDRTEALEKARLFEQVKSASAELEQKVQAATAELAQQNELLRRQAIELEQASAAKSQFLANMSHELRTPLNAVLGYTSMLLQGVSGELQPPQKKQLGRVDSNARHLLMLINDILDITRIEAGRMPVNVSEFALKDLLAEVTAELEPIIARSRLKVTTEVPANLPKLKSDRQKVKQIVVNLLSNALKFTHQGSVRIMATHDAKGRELSVAVQDTGIGIAAEHHEKVFEDFRQLDNSTTRAYGGTGLGLAICKRLATMLDGRITLASDVGKGSTFTLHVPQTLRRR